MYSIKIYFLELLYIFLVLHLFTGFAEMLLLYFAKITVKAGQRLQAFAFGARREVEDKSCTPDSVSHSTAESGLKWDKQCKSERKKDQRASHYRTSRKQDAVECACKSCGWINKDIIIAVMADLLLQASKDYTTPYYKTSQNLIFEFQLQVGIHWLCPEFLLTTKGFNREA